MDDKKKRPITNGAIPSWKVSQYIIFKMRYIIEPNIDSTPIIKPTEIANFKGISFENLVEKILLDASINRWKNV